MQIITRTLLSLVCLLSYASAGALTPPVVGGKLVKRGEFPDVVAITMMDGSLCTGTLLGADLVLTAAHCIEGVPDEVTIGSLDIASPDGQHRKVKWSRAYPDWEHSYDVGVVMLENPVFAPPRGVAQGCASNDRLVRGERLQLVGFGQTTVDASDNNTRLRTAMLEVLDPDCRNSPSCVAAIAPGGELIAGGNGLDACFGDSGGPVYIPTSSGPALLAVVSRGLLESERPCGDGGVFVRADKVVRWIESTTGRVVERVACDRPADGEDPAPETSSGCNAAAGALGSGLTIYYALFCAWVMRRGRRGLRATTRPAWPRSK